MKRGENMKEKYLKTGKKKSIKHEREGAGQERNGKIR